MAAYPFHPPDSRRPAPKPLSVARRADGWSDATWSLPGLTRAVVAVPEHLAATGGTAELGRQLAAVTAELRLQDERLAARMPDT